MTRDANNELVTAITDRWPFLQQTKFKIAPHLENALSNTDDNFVINVDRPSAAIEVTLDYSKRRADLESSTLVLTSSKYEAQMIAERAKGRFGVDFALDLTDKISIKDMATLGSRRKLLVCTPEILHRKILPDNYRFTRLLEAVSAVSLFDLSNFRGVLGSHLFYILKRLSIAKEENRLSFNATAVYLGNAKNIFGTIIDLESEVCRELWMIDGIEIPCLTASIEAANAVSSPSFLAASIGVQLETNGLRTTILTSSRSQAEVVAETITSISSHDGGTEVKPLLYRGGYIDEVRDDIREEIVSGEFKVAVATSQLSIELPQSDVVIFLGIPKTIAQIRRNISTLATNNSALVLLPDSDNLDQWVIRNINSINDRPNESAAINPQNPKIMEYQLLCATDETSIKPEQLSNDRQHQRLIQEGLEENHRQGKLVATDSGHIFVGTLRPSKVGGLRGGDNVTFTLITDDGELLEVFDSSRLFFNFYLGAIHRHRGRRFRITDIDSDQRLVYCTPENSKRYTKPRIESQYSLLHTIATDESLEGLVSLSEIEVTEFFTGYDLLQGKGEVVEFIDYDLEPKTLESEALLFAIPSKLFSEIPINEYGAALHAFEHATIGVLSTISLCDRWDVGGVSFVINGPYNNGVDIITSGGAIAIYDGSDGGSGVARASFARWRELLATSIQNLEECPCEDGCPSCIVSPKCGNSNSLLSKEHGRTLARNLRGWLHPGR